MELLSKDWEGHRSRSQDQDVWLNLGKLYFSKKLLTVALNFIWDILHLFIFNLFFISVI